ncbi:NACHT, LRR and PYD domains-containing protein 5 [Coemansia sp. Benny D160-2]|nr:NACHT, LRR and PYD domains-containing protein 5 [Coemansia sp. Benny D160-2]
MKGTGRHSRGPLVFGRRESTRLANISLVDVNVDDESVVRRVIQQISMGDFAHLPPMSVLKRLLQSERHSAILQKVYRHLSLSNLPIDGTTARVLSVILLSPQCCCQYVHIHRCSFTEQGRNILFSALSVMAATLGPHRHIHLPASGFVGSSSSKKNIPCKTRIAENGYANALESVSSVAVAEKKCHMSAGLVELNYTQIGVSDRNYYTLTDVLLQQSYLHTLNLSNNAMVPKSTERLIEAISSGCPSLRVLDLSGNLLRTDGAQIIARYLISNGRNLESLNVSGNQIPPEGGVALASSLSARLGSKLKVLNIGMNQFEIAGSEALGHALAENRRLEQLVISQNNILDNGCGLLFEGLRSNNTLLSIDISGNLLTHISARSVSSYMTSRSSASSTRLGFDSTGIRTLNMSANPLGDEGIAALCSGLQSNSHLVHLFLDNVEAADPGVDNVRQLLQTTAKNKISLLTLSLRQNRHVTHVGIGALADGCLQNRSILRITVDMCFDRWSTVWDKAERAFIANTMRAIDRYKVPLLMVARGRILLCQYKRQRIGSSTQRLPEEICLAILSALDKHGVLTAKQKCTAFKIAQRMSNKYPTKRALLSAILGSDYRFVSEIMKTLHSF